MQVTNKRGVYLKPPSGGNYVLHYPGDFLLEDGRLRALQVRGRAEVGPFAATLWGLLAG